MRLYDPRDNTWKESNNPALTFLDFVYIQSCEPIPNDIWNKIINWANYCDEEVNTSESKTH